MVGQGQHERPHVSAKPKTPAPYSADSLSPADAVSSEGLGVGSSGGLAADLGRLRFCQSNLVGALFVNC
jgi:hypothetical protein